MSHDSILHRLLAKRGVTPETVSPSTKVGRIIRSRGVQEGPELRRIKALPRRKWEEDPNLPLLIETLTARYKTSKGSQSLRPMQAKALEEIHDLDRGALVIAKVGSGKTLLTALIPTILESKRPLLLVPAKLLDKTHRDFVSLAEHWEVCRNYEYFAYDKLSLAKYKDFLDRYEPDLIVCDEVHKLKHVRKSARAKRVRDFMKEHPDVRFVGLTGTISRKSIKEYSHIAEWCLKDLSPIPRDYSESEAWSCALDAGVEPQNRFAPGCLLELDSDPKPDLEAVRNSFRRRVVETPGVITTSVSGFTGNLIIDCIKFDDYSPATEKAFRKLREEKCTPDGVAFTEPVLMWQFLREMALGFWYRVDPPPPEPWKEARRNWARFVNDVISGNRERIYSEFQVANACARGEYDGSYWRAWKEIKPTFRENRTTVLLDEAPLNRAAAWLSDEEGICFTPFVAAGEKLAAMTGLPYFGQMGMDKKMGSIEGYAGGPCIASIAANVEGRNLQTRWNKGLVYGDSSSGQELEQLLGRFHRDGQEKEEVFFTFFFGCYENWKALEKARTVEGEFDKSTNGNDTHKLLIGDWLIPSEEEVQNFKGARWETY